MRKTIFIAVLVALIFGSSAFLFSDSQGTDSATTHVMVSVASKEESDQNRLQFCIEKELKEFEDISVAQNTPDWKLDIIASRAPVKGSVDEDYDFSVVTLKLSDDKKYVMEGHELMVGYPNLQGGCRDIVRLFTKKYLQKNADEKY